MLGLYILLAIGFLVLVIYLCIAKPISEKSKYAEKQESIFVGMTEAELIAKCGTPSKTVVIDSTCKLISYNMDEWKGILFGGSKHHEITVTVKNGIVTNVSTTD